MHTDNLQNWLDGKYVSPSDFKTSLQNLLYENAYLQAHNDEYLDILADIRDTLLDLVDSKDNKCGDMLVCTVSSPTCIKCLVKQIKKQYLEKS